MDTKKIKSLLSGTLIRGGMWLTFSTVVSQIISFVASAVFFRLLSVGDNGIIAYYTKMVTVFTTVLTLGLTACIQRGKTEYEENYEGFLSSILVLATSVILVFGVLFYGFKSEISSLISINEDLVMLLVIHCFFLFVFQCSTIKYATTYKYRKYFSINMTYNIVALLLSVGFIFLFRKLNPASEIMGAYGRIYGMAFAPIIYGSVFYIRQLRRGKVYVNRDWWKFALIISMPLILHSLSSTVMNYFDTIVIKKVFTEVEVGLYEVPYKLGMLINTFWVAINKAWVPWFFDKMKAEKYEEIDGAMRNYLAMFTYVFFGFIMVSPELGYLQAGSQYADSFILIPIVGLSYYFLFLYSLPSNIEFYEKKTILITIGTIISAVLNILLNLWLIPIYGYKMAAITTLISYMVQFIYHFVVIKVWFNYEFINIKTFGLYILISFAATGYFYLTSWSIIIRYASILIVTILVGLKFKNKLKSI